MDESALNLSIRRFLKEFGVTAQREIERAVAAARSAGTLAGKQSLPAVATLRIPELGVEHSVDGEIQSG